MAHRIEVGFRPQIRDPIGEKIKRRIESELHINKVEKVRIVDVYTIDMCLSEEELETLARRAFSDPIIQFFSIDAPLIEDFDWLIEVGLTPGVTDNVGRTAREALIFCLGKELTPQEKVYTSRQYIMWGDVEGNDVKRIGKELLANELVHRIEILNREGLKKRGRSFYVPRVLGDSTQVYVCEIDIDVSNEELLRISKERLLALNLEEMLAIKDYFSREDVILKRKTVGLGSRITDVELEAIAQTWSNLDLGKSRSVISIL